MPRRGARTGGWNAGTQAGMALRAVRALAEALVSRAAQRATGIPARGHFPGSAGFQARLPMGGRMRRAMLSASAAD